MKTMKRAPDMKLVKGNLFWLEKGVLMNAARNATGRPTGGRRARSISARSTTPC